MNFDLENTRRNLIAKRVAAGAGSEIGPLLFQPGRTAGQLRQSRKRNPALAYRSEYPIPDGGTRHPTPVTANRRVERRMEDDNGKLQPGLRLRPANNDGPASKRRLALFGV